MTHIITCEHGPDHYEITYRNNTIVSIICFGQGENPRGQQIQYDDLSLSERESVLISIINYLNTLN